MGSVVFPDAEIKIFLTASPAARAERRYKQLIGKGIRVKLSSVLDELIERDARDQNRAISPLVISETSIVIDSTQLSVEQVSMEVMNVIISKKITHGMVGQSIT
jgi:cytidylate kinase